MAPSEFIRLRGTIVALSTLLTIVSLLMVIDQRSHEPGAGSDATPASTQPRVAVAVTPPLDNRMCGMANRVMTSLSPNEPDAVRTLQTFYADVATFTEGDMHAEFVAASRFYKEISDIGQKGNWDLDRIVRNNDGERWRALLTGKPTGVEEARQVIRERCRLELPPPPAIATDGRGRILDPFIAQLLAPPEREIRRPPPPPPEETDPAATAADPTAPTPQPTTPEATPPGN